MNAPALAELTRIPGIGPSIARDLYRLGIRQVADLRGRDPELLYSKLCREMGQHVDRCVLYTFRCAVYFASESKPEPELLKWWNWKDGTKAATQKPCLNSLDSKTSPNPRNRTLTRNPRTPCRDQNLTTPGRM
jgi:hypothetical protein